MLDFALMLVQGIKTLLRQDCMIPVLPTEQERERTKNRRDVKKAKQSIEKKSVEKSSVELKAEGRLSSFTGLRVA